MDNLARRDIDTLHAFVLKKPKAYLYSHPEILLTEQQQWQLDQLIQRYQQGEPLAYLTGQQGFWTLDLMVTPATLIPRPETECVVAAILDQWPHKPIRVLDLGTGTGAIALALAHERPDWAITAVDICRDALAVAQTNAQRYELSQIKFIQSDWFTKIAPQKFDVIISNPPYLASDDPHLPQLRHEPQQALVADQQGLSDLAHLIARAPDYLGPGGHLICEHGATQGPACIKLYQQHNYSQIEQKHDLDKKPRFVSGLFQPAC